jgi:hypothetical protein
MPHPRPFADVFDTPVARLDFPGVLRALQELLSVELDIAIYVPEASFTVGFRSRLLRVVELPPDREAVTLAFENGETVTLAPEEILAYCGRSERRGQRTRWVEVQVKHGPCVLLEEAAARG